MIERDLKEPQRFMGELMQAGGRFMLAQLGLEGLFLHYIFIFIATHCLTCCHKHIYMHMNICYISLICDVGVLYVLDCLEEIDAQEAKSLAIYKDRKHATLPFPDDKKFPHEPVGRLLRNGRLVQRLRQKAASLSKYVQIFT